MAEMTRRMIILVLLTGGGFTSISSFIKHITLEGVCYELQRVVRNHTVLFTP